MGCVSAALQTHLALKWTTELISLVPVLLQRFQRDGEGCCMQRIYRGQSHCPEWDLTRILVMRVSSWDCIIDV